LLPGGGDVASYLIASGIDITERKRLEKTILEISAREQRRSGQGVPDGLGQAHARRQGTLTIQDNGCGIGRIAPGNNGVSLHLMNYRARMVGGSLEVQRVRTGGTMVSCLFPVDCPR